MTEMSYRYAGKPEKALGFEGVGVGTPIAI
jgi:hypothetical protein